jgi:hypothetical protein
MEEDKNQAQTNPIKMLQENNNIWKQQITISEEKNSARLGFARCLRKSVSYLFPKQRLGHA